MLPAIIAISIIVTFILVLVIRTLLFKPQKLESRIAEKVSFDLEKTMKSLSEMIKCKTVSDRNKELEDEAEFDKFKAILPMLFPNVFEKCAYEEVDDRAILIKWEGKRHDSPTVLMAHYDVVSVVEEKWDKPAFAGLLEDGVLWGRGALDTKCTLNGVLTASETLIQSGFVPENDIYMAFAGDEEICGHGASDIVKLFIQRNIKPALVLDEGGVVIKGMFPGVKESCALIGIAEKGMLNIEYSISGHGGHASAPPSHTPVGKLSKACVRIEKNPFRYHMNEPAAKMFDTLGRHSTFIYRFVFANRRLLAPLLNLIAKKSGGQFNASVRTTTAFTQMQGSQGMNVIPSYARMVSNNRIIPGETVESTIERIKKVVNDSEIEINAIYGRNPSRISRTDGEGWERISSVIRDVWPEAIVSPYLMVACSDSYHWGAISDKVYRFAAMEISKEERATVHGNNECIRVETVAKMVEFYIRLMKQS